VTTKTSK